MQLDVGAAVGEFEGDRAVVAGAHHELVFVSRASVHATHASEPEHIGLLQRALAAAWRPTGPTPSRLRALFSFLHSALMARAADPRLHLRNWRIELCAAAFEPASVWTASIAANRVWRVRGDVVEQLTEDHTLASAARAAGQAVPEGLGAVVTRVLGYEAPIQHIVVREHEARAGDVFVLSTGWFHELLEPRLLETLLVRAATIADASTAARFLLQEQSAISCLPPHHWKVRNCGVLVARPDL